METDSACSYIHLEVNKSSLWDRSNTMFKVRFYAKKKNLQSLRTKDLCEWKGTTCMWMSKFKGVWACWNGRRPPQTQKWRMADNFIRWSLPHQQRSKNNERFWRRLKPWKSKIKMKTSSNRDDRPLGGDCWDHTFIFSQVSVITFCNKMITTTSTKNKERWMI